MQMSQLKVGLIGLGHLHPRQYMPLFESCPLTRVTAVSEHSEELLKSFCQDFGVKGYTDYRKMIAEERLDIAAIFLPHYQCAQAAVECARRKIHLLVEKPAAESAAAARRIVQAVEEHKVKFTTGYCWRYHPVIAAMKEAIARGIIGPVMSVEARLAAGRVDRYIKGNSGWMLEKNKSGGGPMYNLGVHWIDVLGYLLSDRVAEVCAVHTQSSSAYDIEDSSAALLRFAGGPIGVLTTSYIVPDCFPNGRDLYLGVKGTCGALSYAPRYEGEKGSGSVSQTDVLEMYSDAEAMAGASARQIAFQLDKVSGYSGFMGKAYIEGFAKAILEDKTPLITAAEALDVLNVVEAIYQSGTEKKWIKVQV